MIALLSTGGTISGVIDETDRYSAQSSATSFTNQLRAAHPQMDFTCADLATALSFEIALSQWLEIIHTINKWSARSEINGLIVTQGTALLEEVPFLASLFCEREKPIVFTGAMIPAGQPGSDALINLIDCVTLVSDPTAVHYSPLVVMNRQAFDPATILKQHATSPSSFRASNDLIVAEIDSEGVRWLRRPQPTRPRFSPIKVVQEVPLICMYLGFDVYQLESMLVRNPRAIVVEGFPGGGGLPMDVAEKLKDLACHIPVVLTSRSPHGRRVASAGSRSGGGALIEAGLIPARSLSSERARLLTMAVLAAALPNTEHDAVKRALAAFDAPWS